MILVDTSVFIEYFHHSNSSLYLKLREWIEGDMVAISIVTRLELLAGVSKKDHKKFSSSLNILKTYYPKQDDWNLIESWVGQAKKDGNHFQISDLMIACSANRNKCKLYTFDSDFKRMQKYKWVELLSI